MEPPGDTSRRMVAPGAPSVGAAVRAPGVSEPPSLEDRLVTPNTREEILHGQRIDALPAKPPHATTHLRVSNVVGAHVAPGYQGAVDMLTRASEESDFAPDVSVFPTEPDPETGGRKLEELAFEVVSGSMSIPTGKAEELSARGVRRIFAVQVKLRRVLEWKEGTFVPLPPDSVIDDPCLAARLPVRALLEAAAADDAVARALEVRGVHAIAEMKARERTEGEARGEARGKAAAVIEVLEGRGLTVPEPLRQRILSTTDGSTLGSWLRRAGTVASAEELEG